MQVHFVHQNVQDTVVMLEEGNPPHPRCARCDMQVPRKALNGRHLGTAQCSKGAEKKRQWLAETETRENLERAFKAYGESMKAVSEFRYLGRLLTATDVDWPAVAGNVKKAKLSWGRMAWVLGREGADPTVTGEEKSYKERQRKRVECEECGEQLAVVSMSSHLMTRHGKAAGCFARE